MNIQARITRGIGYGAASISMLGFASSGGYKSLLAFWMGGAVGFAYVEPPVIPPSGGGGYGGGYARQIVYAQPIDDAEEIFLMMVNAFMRTR